MADKILFLDRDGCIIEEPEDEQIDSFEKLRFMPGAISNLARIAKELEYRLVMVTNQDGLGTTSHPEENFWPPHNLMMDILEREGVRFDEVLIDHTTAAENAPTRKPGTAMLTHYIKGDFDLANSAVIGDRETDVELAKNLGSQAIRITGDTDSAADFTTPSWADIYKYLKGLDRRSTVNRKTSETEVSVSLNLDGSGKSEIKTGLGFFDHMLHQLARHGGVDLTILVKGDLHVDEHHTIEDTALTLGKAFHNAMGNKKGMERYGFLLPMDDALAQVAIDFGGRSHLEWDVDFKREKIGDVPTEMFSHFFKSFCDTAGANINVKAEGKNEHHKIESIFKAWARAVKTAVKRSESGEIPSTKGSL